MMHPIEKGCGETEDWRIQKREKRRGLNRPKRRLRGEFLPRARRRESFRFQGERRMETSIRG